MADKFTLEMHKENMRRIIRPRPTNAAMERLKQAIQRRSPSVTPRPKGIR